MNLPAKITQLAKVELYVQQGNIGNNLPLVLWQSDRGGMKWHPLFKGRQFPQELVSLSISPIHELPARHESLHRRITNARDPIHLISQVLRIAELAPIEKAADIAKGTGCSDSQSRSILALLKSLGYLKDGRITPLGVQESARLRNSLLHEAGGGFDQAGAPYYPWSLRESDDI